MTNSDRDGPLFTSPMKGEVKRAFVGRTSQSPRLGNSPFMGEAGRGPSA